jgi:LysM repeat protein
MVGWRNPARYLAPLALAAAIVATYTIVHRGFLAKQTTTTTTASAPQQQLTGLHRVPAKAKAKFYVVRPNDTLSEISARTGVPMSVLESLNPAINPNALQPSQRLRLRR